ncbi:MAG: TrpR-related protein YerC/YecD [Clostridia bacterium]|nr:TrpR-related protein YerC/YecD [Clostridia bacterium]
MKKQLYEVFASLDTPEKVEKMLEDLCTHKEIEYMAQRIEGAKLLMSGNTYNQIIAKTNISTATLGRINRCIQYGSGGYSGLLKNYLKD